MTSHNTQLNAVIGFPLSHSKSPVLHNALYKKLGIDAVMLAFAHKNIADLVLAVRVFNAGLTAVTMPFKRSVMPFLNSIDAAAKAVGAVNTVINKNGKLYGYNTDVYGIANALEKTAIRNKNVLILGAGGSARAAAYYVKSRGGNIFYLNRTKAKILGLKKDFGGKVAQLKQIDADKISVIINATPLGMYPKIKASALPFALLRKNQTVFDQVYNPVQTRLLREAKKRGAKTISGIEMFIGQALRQIELYTGEKIKSNAVKHFAKKILTQSK